MIDIVLIIVFGIAVFTGLRRGLIGQAASIAAVVIAFIACRAFGSAFAGALSFLVPSRLEGTPMENFIPMVISNSLVYLAAYYLVKIIAGAIRATMRMFLMGPLDRVLGVIFAIFKWGLGLSIALNLWLAVFPSSDFVRRSTIGGGVAIENVMEIAPWFWGVASHIILPDDAGSDSSAGNPPTQSGVVNL